MSRTILLITTVTILLAVYLAITLRDDFDPEALRGKRVVVTGSSTGIGEQLAYQFARFGANVLVTSRRENVLKEVVNKCRQFGHKDAEYHYIAGDMTNETFYNQLIETAVEKMGGIDYLVLNHIIDCPIGHWVGEKNNLTMFRKVIDVNLLSYVSLASIALPHIEKSGGSIVVMSSFAGRVPAMYHIAYSSAKFALNGFFSGLRRELSFRQSKVSITICTIGLIGTQNAVQKLDEFGLKKLLEHITPADPADTALAIVKGSVARHTDVYYPHLIIRVSSLIGYLFPNLFEQFENFLIYS